MHRLFDKGPRFASPAEFPNLVPSSPVGHVSIYLGLRGARNATADPGDQRRERVRASDGAGRGRRGGPHRGGRRRRRRCPRASDPRVAVDPPATPRANPRVRRDARAGKPRSSREGARQARRSRASSSRGRGQRCAGAAFLSLGPVDPARAGVVVVALWAARAAASKTAGRRGRRPRSALAGSCRRRGGADGALGRGHRAARPRRSVARCAGHRSARGRAGTRPCHALGAMRRALSPRRAPRSRSSRAGSGRGCRLALPTEAEWLAARQRLAELRATEPTKPFGAVVRVALREPHTGKTFAARGAIAVDPHRALRMVLVGPGGATALDVWATADHWRFEVPAAGLLRRGGREDDPGPPDRVLPLVVPRASRRSTPRELRRACERRGRQVRPAARARRPSIWSTKPRPGGHDVVAARRDPRGTRIGHRLSRARASRSARRPRQRTTRKATGVHVEVIVESASDAPDPACVHRPGHRRLMSAAIVAFGAVSGSRGRRGGGLVRHRRRACTASSLAQRRRAHWCRARAPVRRACRAGVSRRA